MARVRIGTFNLENLFARFRFRSNVDPNTAVADGWRIDQTRFDIYDDASKQITAAIINEIDADVLALQEVEGLDTLKRFRSVYLGGRRAYPHALVIDGNDPRRIDVAVLSRLPIISATTWQHLRVEGLRSPLFSRDCLEVDIEMPNGSILTVYNNHFKSMIGGREATRAKRARQASGVKSLIKDRFGTRAGREQFVVAGDFNDYRGTGSGINSLAGWNQVEDVVRRLDSGDRWTHYWSRGNEYHHLDYLLLSTDLAQRNQGNPHIERSGMPLRAGEYTGERQEGVGFSAPKASDHCPVTFDLDL